MVKLNGFKNFIRGENSGKCSDGTTESLGEGYPPGTEDSAFREQYLDEYLEERQAFSLGQPLGSDPVGMYVYHSGAEGRCSYSAISRRYSSGQRQESLCHSDGEGRARSISSRILDDPRDVSSASTDPRCCSSSSPFSGKKPSCCGEFGPVC